MIMPIPLLAPILAGASKIGAALGGAKGVAALAGGAASLAGSGLDYNSNKAQQKLLEEQRLAEMALIKDYGQRAIESLGGGYKRGQEIRQQALNQNQDMTRETFAPMIQSMQAGDYLNQQAILSGLMGHRSAILGDQIDYGALQAQNVPIDYSMFTSSETSPNLTFAPIGETPEYGSSTNTAAQQNWTDFDAQQYLNANPDIEPDYMRLRPQLLAGGDPQFTTLQGYAKWHYDNYGKQSGRALTGTQPATTQAVFSPEQVRNAISKMGGEQL